MVELPTPLTLIFGLNGVGKTRLLGQIAASMGGAKLVSLHNLVNYLHTAFGIRTDVAEFIEETSPLSISNEHLSAVRDLVRRDYEEIRWYAVPIMDSPFRELVGDDVVPIFVVRHGGVEYDFRTMGLGELSAHLLAWLLSYSRDSRGVPLLLDEPEAFLPPPSRGVVLNYLLEAAIKRQAPIIVASHSLELIRGGLDAESALLLTETGNSTALIGPTSQDLADQVAGLFGRSVDSEWLVLCEDECGYVLAYEALRRFAPQLWQRSNFLWCKGYGDIETIWKHLPRPPVKPEGLVNFAFLADGDMVDEVTAATKRASGEAGMRWPLILLPGDPDELMKNAAEANVGLLADRLNISEGELSGLFMRIRGREPHNWVQDVVDSSGVERQPTLRALAHSAVLELERSGGGKEFRGVLAAAKMVRG
ncbi:hypothetical protein [Micromonospora sp. NPDC051296]|uniref:hypothetical protein n=1 Tax=Micromonospora sp. NPDC051296 TaxID=3155046 RepID=UPI00342A63E8